MYPIDNLKRNIDPVPGIFFNVSSASINYATSFHPL